MLPSTKPQLTELQKASSALSQKWKEESRRLLCGAQNLQEFEKAVIWCGKTGNVIRTLKAGQDVCSFSEHLWTRKPDISNGKYRLSSDLDPFGGNHPYSWASKILHIMNPQQYPLIFDKNIRSVCQIQESWKESRKLAEYENEIKRERKSARNKTVKELFKNDSDWWASVL